MRLMMSKNSRFVLLAATALQALTWAASSSAAPLNFGCDTPADHFADISQDGNGPFSVSGTVKVMEMRSGSNLPVAGARFASADRDSSVALQLVAASSKAKTLDIVLATQRGRGVKRSTIGSIGTTGEISFSLALNDAGQVAVRVNNSSFNAEFRKIGPGKTMVFCSTGHFEFSNLALSSGS